MSTVLEPPDFAKIRLFVPADLAKGGQVVLDGGQAHYLVNVMRKSVGDQVLLFNGRDGEWLVEIVKIGKKAVDLTVVSTSRPQTITPDLELLFAPVKKLRLDFLVQKATELGVSSLRPVITARTNAKVKADRMVANVIEAAEQCGRLDVPQVRPQIALGALLEGWAADASATTGEARRLIFCDEAGDVPELSKALQASDYKGPWSLLVGPEGGFTDDERAELRVFEPSMAVSLGPRIMRADTAALAALAVFQAISGDW